MFILYRCTISISINYYTVPERRTAHIAQSSYSSAPPPAAAVDAAVLDVQPLHSYWDCWVSRTLDSLECDSPAVH